MPNHPGRNEPCPCGSGRKYKKCCGAAAAVDDRSLGRRLCDDAIGDLIRFASRDQFAEWREAVSGAFLDRASDELERCVFEDDASADQTEMAILLWTLYDVEIEPGTAVADLFLRRHGRTLTDLQRRFVAALRATRMRLYEIAHVYPGEGFDLVDLWDQSRVRVRERLGTRQLVHWDLVAGRVCRLEGQEPTFEGPVYLYPREAKQTMMRELRRLRRRAPDETSFLQGMPVWFHWAWVDMTLMSDPPALLTTEGDPMSSVRSVFEIRDRDALTRALNGHAELARDEEGWAWVEPGANRILASFAVVEAQLAIETFSCARDARARALLESVAAAAVRYSGTTVRDPLADASLGQEAGAEASEPPESEAALEILELFQDRHYREWLDMPIPALNNRTPRACAADGRSRHRLVELLKQMENWSARARQHDGDAYDLSWIWMELGLTRPD